MAARRFIRRTLLPLVTLLISLGALPSPAQEAACIDNLAARAKTGSVQLTWTHVAGTIRYDIERATALAGPYAALGSTTSTFSTYLDATVTNGTTYYYRIHRISEEGDCYSGVIAARASASRTAMARVPSLLGDLQADALAELAAASLQAGTVGSAHSDTVGAGRVISQDPPAGSALPANSAVAFVVSDGPAPPPDVLVPDVVGQAQAAAQAELTGAGLAVGTVTQANSDTVPSGSVISQNPAAGASVAPGSAVDLVVSSGPAPVSVPNVVGLSEAAAGAAIAGAGLAVGDVTSASSDTVPAGNAISQDPAAGTSVAPGSAVDLVISSGPAPVSVPNVVGLAQAAAEAAITGAGLAVGTVTQANSDTVPAGSVISQNPAAGASVASGSAVDLVVSSGPAPVSVPNVVGFSQAAASAAITAADLVVGDVTNANSDTVPAGSVISQDPAAGASVAPGSAVDLVVSIGPANATVPNVVGLGLPAAENLIQSAGFSLGTETGANSDTVPAGNVISQNPAAGASVPPGTAVNLVYSIGPANVTVPDVVNLTQTAATTALTNAGLVVGTVTQANSNTVPSGSVISQNPVAGASVAPGSAVSLVVSIGPALVSVPNVVNLTQAAATAAITGAGLVVGTVSTANSNVVPAGSVISQSPGAGSSVLPGSAVNLTVSTGPAQVTVPNVVNLTQAAATTAITGAGLVVGTVTNANSDTVPSGSVISQNPTAGTNVAPGSAVNLVVSVGPALVAVPNVVNLTQAAATTAITNAGLVLGTVSQANSNTVPAGSVISQNPAAGAQVSAGAAVDLIVSTGPAGATPASLNLTLSQLVVGAGDPLTITSQVLDGGGNPIASPPSVTYAVLWNAATSTGTIPGVNGTSIVTAANTRGSFQLQGTVTGTSVTATIGFTVLQNASQSDNAAQLTGQSLAQARVTQNVDLIAAAVQSGNAAAIGPALAAMNAAAASVNTDKVGLATGYEPDVGFIPTAAQLAARYPQTQADLNFATLTTNIRNKVRQITTLLQTPTGNDAADTATLATYVSELTTLQGQLQQAANTPTPNGLARNALAVDALLGDEMPAVLKAVASRVTSQLQAAGLASNAFDPDGFYRTLEGDSALRLAASQSPAALYASQQPTFLLTGLLGSCGTIGNLIQKIYGPFLDQLQKMAILLAAQGLLNSHINNFPGVAGLITGGSQSFHVYHAFGSVIEVTGISLAQAQAAEVYLVGGAAVNALDDAANAVGGINGVDSIAELYNFLEELYNAVQGLADGLEQAHQQPNSYFATSFWDGGCLSSLADSCIEMYYDNGFDYVGSGGPLHLEPVIILIRIPDPTAAGYGSAIFNFVGQ